MEIKLGRATFAILLLILLGLSVTFDTYLGQLYTGMIISAIILYIVDTRIDIRLQREFNPLRSIVVALIGSAVVLGGAMLISSLGIFSDMVPYFKGNVYFTVFSYGLVVAVIETLWLWGPYMELFLELLGVNPRNATLKDAKVWAVLILSTIIFGYLHITSKAGNPQDLVIVGLMAMVTGIMVVYEKMELLSAILMHVFLNTTAIIIQKQLADMGLALMIALGAIIILSYSTKYLKNIQSRIGV